MNLWQWHYRALPGGCALDRRQDHPVDLLDVVQEPLEAVEPAHVGPCLVREGEAEGAGHVPTRGAVSLGRIQGKRANREKGKL